jgi:hypothetical protein
MVEPCRMCGYEFDQEALGVHGCPECHAEGLDGLELVEDWEGASVWLEGDRLSFCSWGHGDRQECINKAWRMAWALTKEAG